jgi:uncharacterized protein YacL
VDRYKFGMTYSPLNIAIFVAMGLVFAVLVAGIVNLALNNDKARSRSNQLMRLRVIAQFIAVILLMIGFWLKSRSQ